MTDPLDELRRYAASLRAVTDEDVARRSVARAMAAGRRPARPARRPAVLAAAAVLLGNAGLAAAAEPAVPGDVLYGVDRAYERLADAVGLGTDRAAERLAEATELVARGRPEEAGAVLDEIPPGELREAVAELRATVADGRGEGAGRSISDAARSIGDEAPGRADPGKPAAPGEQAPAHPGSPGREESGPVGTAPEHGRPDPADRPADPGPRESVPGATAPRGGAGR